MSKKTVYALCHLLITFSVWACTNSTYDPNTGVDLILSSSVPASSSSTSQVSSSVSSSISSLSSVASSASSVSVSSSASSVTASITLQGESGTYSGGSFVNGTENGIVVAAGSITWSGVNMTGVTGITVYYSCGEPSGDSVVFKFASTSLGSAMTINNFNAWTGPYTSVSTTFPAQSGTGSVSITGIGSGYTAAIDKIVLSYGAISSSSASSVSSVSSSSLSSSSASSSSASSSVNTNIAPANSTNSFTLVVIPDSQFMVCNYNGGVPSQFVNQVQWIKNNVATLNIKMVSHVGDIADAGDQAWQWANVTTAIGDLENFVPFGMAYGNHDYCSFTPSYHLDKGLLAVGFRPAFPLADFSGKSWFGGNFPAGVMDNNYQLFSASGMDFIIIHLGDAPDAAARSWASGVLDLYPNRRAIISTHSYMGGAVYSYAPGSIWYDVVKTHDNVFLLVCGHDNSREVKVENTNDFGHKVYQILTDYQGDSPQKAMLRYYKFQPGANTIEAYTLSTDNGVYETDANSRFNLTYQMQ